MIPAVVTLEGPPGSGKSTAGRLVAQRLGLDYRSVGEVFREEARRRGMSLAEFGRYAEAHPEVDQELDRSMQAYARPGFLLDGRVQGALCRRRGIPVIAIEVTADEEVRARRLAGRDQLSAEAALEALREREESEATRFERFYDIDLDLEEPDLLVDATSRTPQEVADAIVAFLEHPPPRAPA
ncbi:MAG TPA: cytidylate kinase family protein [Thermoplasmata archaeon]|nr:cytidylate kinase family protein [Thermoplasmata archaeon]